MGDKDGFSSRDFLEANIDYDPIEIKCSRTPVFVDCGSNLERIVCPKCGTELSFNWWSKAMGRLNESEFILLETKLPCCGKIISLNDLKYYFPCGFACCEIDILNPICDFGDYIIDSIQKILGINVRIIKARI